MGLIDSLWIIGAILLGLVLLQSLVVLFGGVRRLGHQRRQYQLECELIEQRVAAARAIRAEREQAALAWNGYRKFEVQRKVEEGGGICSFYLVAHDRKQLAGFSPGQYLTFGLQIPDQDKTLVRCYSLSDAPRDDYYRVSIKRVPPPRDRPDLPPGRSSNFFHDSVNEGDILDVKAPSGHFFLDMSKDTPVVLIGGGVGITPVLSMLNTITNAGSKRETWFFYGVRHREEHVMADHLRQIAADHDNVKLHICYSDPRPEEDREGLDYQHGARVSVDLFKQLLPSNNYDFYMCGPPPMMASLTDDLAAWGVPKDRVHLEAFGPASVKKPKKAEPVAADAPVVEVTFGRSGKTLAWDREAESLLDFAEANGIVIDSGCRAGNCGTCLTAIRSGEVEYNTEPGAEAEEGSCLTCVCVPKGPLVLDA